MTSEEITKRPPPDHRDYHDIGTGGDDDDSFRHRQKKDDQPEGEERTLH